MKLARARNATLDLCLFFCKSNNSRDQIVEAKRSQFGDWNFKSLGLGEEKRAVKLKREICVVKLGELVEEVIDPFGDIASCAI